jgi:hypothetical protein
VALRDDAMLDSFADDVELSRTNGDLPVSFENLKHSLDDKEHLILILMGMPRDLVALASHGRDKLVVQLTDDLWREGILKHFKAFLDIHHFRHLRHLVLLFDRALGVGNTDSAWL